MTERRMNATLFSIVSLALTIICILYGRPVFNFVAEIGEVIIYWGICGIISFVLVFSTFSTFIRDQTYKEIHAKIMGDKNFEQITNRKLFYAFVATMSILVAIVNYFWGQSIVNLCFEVFEFLVYYSLIINLIMFVFLGIACTIMNDKSYAELFDDSEITKREQYEAEILERYLNSHKTNFNSETRVGNEENNGINNE